jgi:HSP20 family molecular chaperone IbpA
MFLQNKTQEAKNMPFDYNYQPINVNSGSTPYGAAGDYQQQEAPARENPGRLELGAYPGEAPQFVPYTQYPVLTWQPRVDIFEDHDNFLVVVEVPGVNPEQLNVENSSNLLLISGQNLPAMSSAQTMAPRYQERLCGGFSRSIPLPPHADIDQAKATCKDGLLEITVPKKGPASSVHPGQQPEATASAEAAGMQATSGQPGQQQKAAKPGSKRRSPAVQPGVKH